MTRVLLQYVLPLLLPTLVFLAWLLLTRKPGENREDLRVRLLEGPWSWLGVAGFALMAVGLVYLGLSQGHAPGGTYEAPRYEGGRIIPGQFKEPSR